MKKWWIYFSIAVLVAISLFFWKFYFNQNSEGEFCGGIAAIQCPSGYVCELDGNYPDAGGVCVEEEVRICTLEYNPVCGVDGETYSNPCFAGDVEIAYTGEC